MHKETISYASVNQGNLPMLETGKCKRNVSKTDVTNQLFNSVSEIVF